MDQLFQEIRAAIDGGTWLLALFGVLAIPDICAALNDPEGESSGPKYKKWFAENLGDKYSLPSRDPSATRPFPRDPESVKDFAHEFYKLRCTMLHEGSSNNRSRFDQIGFLSPGSGFHKIFINNGGQQTLTLDLPKVAKDMIGAAQSWLAANQDREPVKSNLAKLVRWRESPPNFSSDVLWLG